MRRGFSRRELLATGAKIGAIGAVATRLPRASAGASAPASAPLSAQQKRTLDAALGRMIPADGPDDWSAADVGAGDYIARLLSGDGRIYAGGPTRRRFAAFRRLSRAKEMGWEAEIRRLRRLYADGLAALDRRSGGSFADAPAPLQDLVLSSLDLEGSAFFAVLYAHTMEGVYAHPVYGGNRAFRAWTDLCYQGDVHGVRFPAKGGKEPWNVYGGYAPDEMITPGSCPGQGPAT